MWRALVYIAILCLIAIGAVWLSGLSGLVTVQLPHSDIDLDLPVAAALVIALGLVLAVAWTLVGYILRLPWRIGRASRTRRRAKGYTALSRGMIAVGAGDTGKARRYAKDAQRLLGEEPLTLLLDAQVAQVSGNRDDADAAFRKMIGNEETRLLGLRGLFIEARRQGDTAAAYRHAHDAVALAPAAGWANEAVLEAQCAAGAWADALDMVDKRAAFGLIDKQTARRQRAVLLTANAIANQEHEPQKALQDALHALKFAPDLIPAATLAARLLGRNAEVRKAAKILEKAWSANPHPDLADCYVYLRAGDSAQDRLKRAEALGGLSNWHPEARIAIAHAALQAREFKRARDVLAPLIAEHPSVRVCLLMADIEQAEHGSVGHAREWVARAARAPRDPAWCADGIISDHWAPFSPVSGRLDAFVWQTPPDTLALSDAPHLDIDATDESAAVAGQPVADLPAPGAASQVIEHEAADAKPAPVPETRPAAAKSEAAKTEAAQPRPASSAPDNAKPATPAPEAKQPQKPQPAAAEPARAAAAGAETAGTEPAGARTAVSADTPVARTPPEHGGAAAAPARDDAGTAATAAAPSSAKVNARNGPKAPPQAGAPLIPPPAPAKPRDDKPIAVTPKPVVFPIAHAPDDPGVDDGANDNGKR